MKICAVNFQRMYLTSCKTPLTSISGIAEIIKNGIVDKKDVKPFAGKIYDEARRLIHLVEDIIKLSQLDEGEQAVEMTQIDLYDLTKIRTSPLGAGCRGKTCCNFPLEGEHVNGFRYPFCLRGNGL